MCKNKKIKLIFLILSLACLNSIKGFAMKNNDNTPKKSQETTKEETNEEHYHHVNENTTNLNESKSETTQEENLSNTNNPNANLNSTKDFAIKNNKNNKKEKFETDHDDDFGLSLDVSFDLNSDHGSDVEYELYGNKFEDKTIENKTNSYDNFFSNCENIKKDKESDSDSEIRNKDRKEKEEKLQITKSENKINLPINENKENKENYEYYENLPLEKTLEDLRNKNTIKDLYSQLNQEDAIIKNTRKNKNIKTENNTEEIEDVIDNINLLISHIENVLINLSKNSETNPYNKIFNNLKEKFNNLKEKANYENLILQQKKLYSHFSENIEFYITNKELDNLENFIHNLTSENTLYELLDVNSNNNAEEKSENILNELNLIYNKLLYLTIYAISKKPYFNFTPEIKITQCDDKNKENKCTNNNQKDNYNEIKEKEYIDYLKILKIIQSKLKDNYKKLGKALNNNVKLNNNLLEKFENTIYGINKLLMFHPKKISYVEAKAYLSLASIYLNSIYEICENLKTLE